MISALSVTVLNDHFACTSSDTMYESPRRKAKACRVPEPLTEWQVFCALDHLHHTATGLDQLPAWFVRAAAPILTEPITILFNRSLATSYVPTQWKTARILPLPKITSPS